MELQPLQTGTTYSEDDVINMIKAELGKVAPNVPVETIVNLIQQELSKLSVSVNVAPIEAPGTEPKAAESAGNIAS